LSAPAQQQVDDMLQELREKASLSALESMKSAAAISSMARPAWSL
jgi:hypothetical protein